MSVREDTETAAVRAMELVGTNDVAIVLAWGMTTLGVLMELEMNGHQQNAALELFTCWTALTPQLWNPDGWPRVYPPEEVPQLTKLFADVRDASYGVRLIRPLLAHHADDVERDQEILLDARTFCESAIRQAQGLARQGIVTCEHGTMDELVRHIRRLLLVVLGTAKMAQFDAKHAEIISSLRGMVELANAPRT